MCLGVVAQTSVFLRFFSVRLQAQPSPLDCLVVDTFVVVDLPVSFCVCRFYVCHPHRSDPACSCAPPSGAPGREVEESRQTLVPRRGIALLL
jgi:hypothetical protein